MKNIGLSTVAKWVFLSLWLGLVISCVRDDDWDMRAPGQDTAPRPEIQSPSRQEIQRFIDENRLLNPTNSMSYSAVGPIR